MHRSNTMLGPFTVLATKDVNGRIMGTKVTMEEF
jgi:hypothetical protein